MKANELTYLEDVEPARKTTEKTTDKVETTGNTSSNSVQVKDAEGTSQGSSTSAQGTTLKRQMSIVDMFSAKAGSGSTSAKRQKVEASSSGTVIRRSATGVAPLNSIPLNLDAFRASLSDETRELLKLELDTMGKSWLKVLTDEIKKPYFISLKRWLASEGLAEANSSKKTKIYPPAKDIYSWSQTPLGRVRVVIIGQDPYHAPGQAHGLCFSVPKGVTPPPSLKNIYAEIQAEYPEFKPPSHGNLSAWASNGVLLLNTCLTVRAHEAGSHSNKGWEQFTDRVVDIIDRYGGANLPSQGVDSSGTQAGAGRGVVFLAWGSWAMKRVAKLSKKKHLILTSAHPSPLSAYRGFFGNNHFQAANSWLEQKYGKDGIVDWCKLD